MYRRAYLATTVLIVLLLAYIGFVVWAWYATHP